jgi:predicted NAD/FAD-binding protein
VLSTPVRDLRRRAADVQGSIVDRDGATRPIDAATLRDAPERALRLLSAAVPLLALAMLAAKEL